MKFLRAHRGWIIILVLAVALIAGRSSLLHFVGDRAAHNLEDVKAARVKAEADLKQLHDDVIAARKLGSEIDRKHAEQVLAPTDRLKAAVAMEKEAAAFKIARFAYTLAPEEHVTVDTGGDTQMLASSTVTLAGDAPDDLFVYNFINHTQHLLPGRMRLQQLTITRLAAEKAPLTALNVHFEATCEWLSNGTLQTVAGGL